MATIVPSVTWCWKPISKCPVCGSSELELDEELEWYKCQSCGGSCGGALFWELEQRLCHVPNCGLLGLQRHSFRRL